MNMLAHITFNEIAFVAGVFLLGFAAGIGASWQVLRRFFGPRR